MKKKKLQLIILYLAIPAVFVIFILWQNLPVSGQISQNLSFGSLASPKIISDLYPGDRTDPVRIENSQKVLPIINDNVYFDITFPVISYDNLRLEIDLIKPSGIPEILLGIPRGPEQFENVVLSNEHLDNLDWDKIEDDSLVLWQKERKYNSLEDFLANPPRDDITAVHPTAPTPQLFLQDYEPSRTTQKLPAGLRGSQRLFTYIKDQSLRFSFTKNGEPHDNSEMVRILDFAGNEITKTEISRPDDYSLDIPDLPEGLYRLEIILDTDNSLTDITTSLDKLVAKNLLWLTENMANTENPLDIVFGGDGLVATNTSDGSLEIEIDEKTLNLPDANNPKALANSFPEIEASGQNVINTKEADLKLEGRGYFALSQDSYFSPEPTYTFQMSPHTTSEEFARADYVIAKYNTNREISADNIISTVEMPILPLFKQADSSPFVISTPGLAGDCEEIYLQSLRATLTRDKLSAAEIKRILSKIF